MTRENGTVSSMVDVVIPVYRECWKALEATLLACLRQTKPVNRIFVVDDGSPIPASLPKSVRSSEKVTLIRLKENQGISAARNVGISQSKTPFVACINVDVLPDSDWVYTCHRYLTDHPRVGACGTRVLPQDADSLLTRWRMRFLEAKLPAESGPVDFILGHAAFFRRAAIDQVQGYDSSHEQHKHHLEDSDICRRMRVCGWDSHFIADSQCVSIQNDSLRLIATKLLRDSGWYGYGNRHILFPVYFSISKWTVVRAGRNVFRGRFNFLLVDIALWAYSICIATGHIFRTNRTQQK
jgi:mycofactocin glycosyltransferase